MKKKAASTKKSATVKSSKTRKAAPGGQERPARAAKGAKAATAGLSQSVQKPQKQDVPHNSKQTQLISLLQSDKGATLEQMTKLTGWQQHTVRGVISGVLRKKLKLSVVTEKPKDGDRIYRIDGNAAAPISPASSGTA